MITSLAPMSSYIILINILSITERKCLYVKCRYMWVIVAHTMIIYNIAH